MDKPKRLELIQNVYDRKLLGMVMLGCEDINGDPISVIEIYKYEESEYYLYIRHPSQVQGSQYVKVFNSSIPEVLRSHIVFQESEYFWVPWNSFHRYFSTLHVCHLTLSALPPRYSPGFFLDVISDSWSEGFAGGGIESMTWQVNPKYRLSVGRRKSFTLWKIRITITLKDYDASLISEPIGLTVCDDEPLLSRVIVQSSYQTTRDVSVEFPVYCEVGSTAQKTMIIIPSTKNPNVCLSYHLAVSIQCDIYPRGVREGHEYNQISPEDLHKDKPDLECVMKSHLRSNDDEVLGEDRRYLKRKSSFSLIEIERISGWDAQPYSTVVTGQWSPDFDSGPFRGFGTSGGRIGVLNKVPANNPCYRV
jgi:hypothetical protein